MAKTLFLVRHAEAEVKDSRQEDKSRNLTSSGVQAAVHLGHWLRDQNIQPDLFVSSSAERAERTAALIAESMKVKNVRMLIEDDLYEASVRTLLECINRLEDGYDNVLLTGHNPALTYLAEYLTKADVGNLAPGALAIVSFSCSSWKEVSENTGVLEKVHGPWTIDHS